MSFFFCGDAPRRGALSMPRGSAPIIPCGSAFRICLWQIHGSRRRAGARMDIQTDVFFCFVEMHRCFASLPYLSLGALPLLYPAAPPSFSPPANDAIPLRLALLNACLAPCAGRAEPVYHIIDGTGKETVRKCRFGNWHISETERLAARLAMEMYMSVRIVACIAPRNGTMASAQFVSDAVRPVLDDMDQPGGSEQSQGA